MLLAAAALPTASPDACAALPLGVRDRLVLALRVRTFGREMMLRSRCRGCAAELVAHVDLAKILSAYSEEPPADVRVVVDGEMVVARLPSSQDVLATRALTPEQAEWRLYERCVTVPEKGTAAGLRETIADALASADPLMTLEIEFECESCHLRFAEPFDIVSGFWKEIDHSAARVALDVHALASEYGWSETEILAMSSTRRARYLALRDR